MLFEAYKYLTSECRPEFRKLGYLHEMVGLLARERRLHRLWRPHHQQCQDLIRQAAELCPFHRRVVVLGSGLLEDLPLDYLVERFEQVVLVDVIHLAEVRQRLAEYPSVQLIEEDISGLSASLLAMRRGDEVLPEPRGVIPGLSEDTDLVVSANLLSQLSLVPLNYVLDRFDFSNQECIDWCQAIIQDHLNRLMACPCRVCLITDLVHVQTNRLGEELRREDMLFGVLLPDAAWLWDWELAPFGELPGRKRVSAVVSGFVNFPYPGE